MLRKTRKRCFKVKVKTKLKETTVSSADLQKNIKKIKMAVKLTGKNKRTVAKKDRLSNRMAYTISSANLNNSQKKKRDSEITHFMIGSFDLVPPSPEQEEGNTTRKKSCKKMTGLKTKEKGVISSNDLGDKKKRKIKGGDSL